MNAQPTRNARTIAAEVLTKTDPRKDFAAEILSKFISQTDEKQRATDIVFGMFFIVGLPNLYLLLDCFDT